MTALHIPLKKRMEDASRLFVTSDGNLAPRLLKGSIPCHPYIDRIATIGCTDAARRAGARLATIATSTAIAAPAT